MGPAGWLFMGLFWIVLLGLLAWAAIALLPGVRGTIIRSDDPREILDRRFARGELDAEQYRQARNELTAARNHG